MPKKPQRPKRLRLTKRDFEVLHDARDFGLVVPELIAPYRFANKAPGAVTSTLRRLYGESPWYRYLRPEPLDGRRVYYRLTARGGQLVGAPRSMLRRYGNQSLIRRYALAWLICAQRPHARKLLDNEALGRLLPGFDRVARHGYYLETCTPTRLGHALVDHGADPIRIVRRAVRIVERLIAHQATAPFVAKNRLTFAVLTFDERKRETLDAALRGRFAKQLRTPLWRLGKQARLNLETYCVPGLAPLVLRDFS